MRTATSTSQADYYTTNNLAPRLPKKHHTKRSKANVPKSKSSSSLFTPAQVPLVIGPSAACSHPTLVSSKSSGFSKSFKLSKSSPSLSTSTCPFPYTRASFFTPMRSDSEDEDEMICTSWPETSRQRSTSPPPYTSSPYASSSSVNLNGDSTKSKASFRTKVFEFASGKSLTSRSREKLISTKQGEKGAGETETEIDEPPRHLPTTRNLPSTPPLIPPNTLQQRITPLLFEFSRWLSIVPALVGLFWNVYLMWDPSGFDVDGDANSGPGRPMPRIGWIISLALLTGWQCLFLTTGLLARWRLYYPPLATLIRLLALQAICWPATHFTLKVCNVGVRPVLTWAVVGTTTCASRSVQVWVTSNLWWEEAREGAASAGRESGPALPGLGQGPNGMGNGIHGHGPTSMKSKEKTSRRRWALSAARWVWAWAWVWGLESGVLQIGIGLEVGSGVGEGGIGMRLCGSVCFLLAWFIVSWLGRERLGGNGVGVDADLVKAKDEDVGLMKRDLTFFISCCCSLGLTIRSTFVITTLNVISPSIISLV
ncbi:hypothetical protein D9758_004495 [Tetrapyrgos nigripes]|uniref:Uncharacterized protein n=1 Tax=Tetrapyrgos nigripes TaxID=182062 RepID=A0A8H5GN74_9AGAR|nr:hypothetical protein D9758_004495 [Tetrapyrgos nigripes]